MKQIFPLVIFLLLVQIAFTQNVGIGEANPAVKLTVRATGLSSSLLVKNGNDDSLILSGYRSIHFGGYHNTNTGVVAISNKHYLPSDPAQLELVAAGERNGGNASGSLNMIKLSNYNSNKYFLLSSYAGAQTANQFFGVSYLDPDDALIFRNLFHLKPNGQTGFGTFEPEGKMQINHRASSSTPTLNLVDSSVNFLPVIQMKSVTGTQYFQLRGNINQTTPGLSYLDFATREGIQMTMTGSGRLGIGSSNPTEKLDVDGNVRVSGEVNRASTGGANLVPICYGQITANGGINNGSGNFTVAHPLTGFYEITITDEIFIYSQYVTIVTPVSGVTPIIAMAASGSSQLHVRTMTPAGTLTNNIFNFVVYKQ